MEFGMDRTLVKYYLSDKNLPIVIVAISIMYIIGVISFIIIYFFEIFSESILFNFILFFVITSRAVTCIKYIVEAEQLFASLFKFQIAVNLILFVLKIAVIYYTQNSSILLIVLCIENLAHIFLVFLVLKRNHSVGKRYDFISDLKVILKSGTPLLIASLAVILYQRIDILMIKEYISLEGVAVYTVAARLIEAVYIIPLLIQKLYQPKILSLSDESGRQKLYSSLYGWIFILSLLIFAFIMLIPSKLISYALTQKYILVSEVIAVYAFSLPFVFISLANGVLINDTGKYHIVLEQTVLGLSMNVILNFALIPKYGMTGAAVASVIAHTAACLYFLVYRRNWVVFTYLKLGVLGAIKNDIIYKKNY